MNEEQKTILNDIADLKEELAELKKREEELENCENDEEYDNYIDEVAGEVDILGMKYQASTLLTFKHNYHTVITVISSMFWLYGVNHLLYGHIFGIEVLILEYYT
jgi:hypothetical protein